jgi:hypothetical protein
MLILAKMRHDGCGRAPQLIRSACLHGHAAQTVPNASVRCGSVGGSGPGARSGTSARSYCQVGSCSSAGWRPNLGPQLDPIRASVELSV